MKIFFLYISHLKFELGRNNKTKNNDFSFFVVIHYYYSYGMYEWYYIIHTWNCNNIKVLTTISNAIF